MAAYVRVVVEVENGARETWQVELQRRPPGDNPRFHAENVRGALDEIRERAAAMLVSQYGDKP
jgi:hypothetical protein